VFNAHPHIAAALCERGADPMVADRSGATPLHDAASAGCCHCVLLLLVRVGEVGAMRCAVEARDSAGMTPVFTALAASAMPAASLILAAGADIDAADNRGVHKTINHVPKFIINGLTMHHKPQTLNHGPSPTNHAPYTASYFIQ